MNWLFWAIIALDVYVWVYGVVPELLKRMK
jgi:hypothetical protein